MRESEQRALRSKLERRRRHLQFERAHHRVLLRLSTDDWERDALAACCRGITWELIDLHEEEAALCWRIFHESR